MVYRVAIVDDSERDAEFVREMLRQWAAERQVAVEIEEYSSAERFLFRYAEDSAFDILLLDIEMGAMDGVTMARRVRRDNEAVQIVFITGYSDYIAEGYEVAALHYLMKPVRREKLFAVLDRALEKLQKNEKCLTLELDGELMRVPIYRISCAEVQGNYVTIHAAEDYMVRMTLTELMSKLDERFFRIGRSALVNLTKVSRVTKAEVYLSDGVVLPLPRGAYELLNRAIIRFT